MLGNQLFSLIFSRRAACALFFSCCSVSTQSITHHKLHGSQMRWSTSHSQRSFMSKGCKSFWEALILAGRSPTNHPQRITDTDWSCWRGSFIASAVYHHAIQCLLHLANAHSNYINFCCSMSADSMLTWDKQTMQLLSRHTLQ